jgi:hypothetical protein
MHPYADSLTIWELRDWLETTPHSRSRQPLANHLVRPFGELLESNLQALRDSVFPSTVDVDTLRFPFAFLPKLAALLSDGLVDCFIIDAYPSAAWFDDHPDLGTLHPLAFSVMRTWRDSQSFVVADEAMGALLVDDLDDLRLVEDHELPRDAVPLLEPTWNSCCHAFDRFYHQLPVAKPVRELAGELRLTFTAIEPLSASEALPSMPSGLAGFAGERSFAHLMLASPLGILTPTEWLALCRLRNRLEYSNAASTELTAGVLPSGKVIHAEANGLGALTIHAQSIGASAFTFRTAL